MPYKFFLISERIVYDTTSISAIGTNYNAVSKPLGATSHKVVVKINSKPCSITSNNKKQVNILSRVSCSASFCDFQRENNEPRTGKW